MGEGTFAKVVECWDRTEKKRVAVKIVRSVERYTDAANIEIDILKDLKKHDPNNEQYVLTITTNNYTFITTILIIIHLINFYCCFSF